MGPRDFTEARLAKLQSAIRHLEQSEFPYRHSEDALKALDATISASLLQIRSLESDASPEVVKQRCVVESEKAWPALPLMGFLLRTTNVRNAFEVFRPILRISRCLLGAVGVSPEDVRVLLSSEWNLSPFVFQSPFLKGYVFVGLPASESSNPLILPLAGHELGHAVWAAGGFEQRLGGVAGNKIIPIVIDRWGEFTSAFPTYANTPTPSPTQISSNLFLMDLVAHAYRFAIMQIQESFCDFLGLGIFGDSYLHAFAYLLSPSCIKRSPNYPSDRVRASNLVHVAEVFGYRPPSEFLDWFEDLPLSAAAPTDQFIVSLADNCLARMIDDIREEVHGLLTKAQIIAPDLRESARVRRRLDRVMPAEQISSLADVINAGWEAYNDEHFWESKGWDRDRKRVVLQDLLLKSVEIMDIEAIFQESALGS